MKKKAADIREVLAQNLRALMRRYPDLSTQAKVAAKAGIAQTSVSNMLNPRDEGEKFKLYPKLDQIEKVAAAFGREVWQLLIDPRTLGDTLGRALTEQPVGDDDARLVAWADAKKRQPLKQ